MEEIFPALATFIEQICGTNASPSLVRTLRCVKPHPSNESGRDLEALLRFAQVLNKTILSCSKMRPGSKKKLKQTNLDMSVVDLIEKHVASSDSQISKAIDELLKRTELFENIQTTELDEIVDMAISGPSDSSSTYVARQPRLPGLPLPPPDEFGEWDEYRDDLDPGYRVREVYEDDLRQESDASSQSTSVTQPLNQAFAEDELLQISYEPSPVPMAVGFLDENDELSGAAPIHSLSQTPSLGTDRMIIAGGDSARTTGADSPSFGSESVQTVATTFVYDYMGNSKEVLRQPPNGTRASFLVPKLGPEVIPLIPSNIDSIDLPIIFESGKTGFESTKEFDSSNGVLVAGRYRISGYLGSAAFSRAVKALDEISQKEVCLKIIKNDKDYVDQSLDEIKMLRLLSVVGADKDKNCVSILDYFYWKEHLVIVTELLLDNLYEFSKFNRNSTNHQEPYFTLGRLQKISKQILIALQTIHQMGMIHCDLKPENILFKSYTNCQIKVIDFGSCCFQTDRLSSYVQSRCYRAPEVILGCLPYDSGVDMWSLGCILAELWTGFVLFQNNSSQSLLARIIGIIGRIPDWMLREGKNVDHFFTKTANDRSLFIELDAPGVVSGKGRLLQLLVPKRTSLFQRMRIEDLEFLDFLSNLLQIDPNQRITASHALMHPWLTPGKYTDGL
jgi:serine/threonine protein kinase